MFHRRSLGPGRSVLHDVVSLPLARSGVRPLPFEVRGCSVGVGLWDHVGRPVLHNDGGVVHDPVDAELDRSAVCQLAQGGPVPRGFWRAFAVVIWQAESDLCLLAGCPPVTIVVAVSAANCWSVSSCR